MGKVIIDMSMTLDGFVAGPNDSIQQPLGDRGSVFHEWLLNGDITSKYNHFFKLTSSSRDVLDESSAKMGSTLVGRRTYDVVEGWRGGHPIHGGPVCVLTHEAPAEVSKGATPFTFVTDGTEIPIKQAKTVAGHKDVGVAGASTAQQCLPDGLVDEFQTHLVPVLLGNGDRLFEHIGTMNIGLETTSVIDSPGVTHLKYRVVR